jgi:hypothetical protein
MSLLDTASLIVTPNGYKEGKLYSVIPSDGSGDLSVTRATTATRVNSAGLLELVPYNLLSYSEAFDNGAWTKSSITISANSTTAPNGQTTADTITNSSSSGIILQTYSSVNTSQIVTHSVYLKRTNNDWAVLAIARSGATTYGEMYVWFNLSTGVVGGNLPDGAAVILDTEIEDAGNGWYRCSVTGYVLNAVAYTAFMLYPDGNNSFTRVTGQSVYAWGAQLVEGSTAKDYQKTETRLNIPRLDYSNGTCPSLLVEPQRTNAVTYSEFFSTANGYNYQNASQSGSSIVSPSGLLAYGITSTTSANDFHRYYKTLGGRSGVNTTTIFAKQGTSRYLGLGVNQNGSTGNNNVVVFDLQDGVIASNTYGVTASIEDFGDGWYRLVHTFDYGTGGTYADICVHNTGTSTYTINAFQTFDSPSSPTTIYVWGLQMEVGSYATSYIPTTSASVTRNADLVTKTSATALIGQTEGTLFVDAYITGKDSSNGSILFATDKVSSGALIRIIYTSTNALRFDVFDGSSFQCLISAGAYNVGDRVKVAGGYKNNDFVMYVNGTQIGTDTSGSVPTTDTANINTSIYGDTNGSFVNAVALWKTRLTNTQLAQLTTI